MAQKYFCFLKLSCNEIQLFCNINMHYCAKLTNYVTGTIMMLLDFERFFADL